MKLLITDSKLLKDSITIINDLVSECLIIINSEGLSISGLDPNKAAKVDFDLSSSMFDNFEVQEQEILKVNLSDLKSILRRCKPTEILKMETDDAKLILSFTGKSTRTFTMPLLENDQEAPKTPNLSFKYVVETTTEKISDCIEDAAIVSDALTLFGEQNKICVKAEGDLNKVFIEIPEDDSTTINTQETEPVIAKYSISYMKKLIAGSKLVQNVKLEYSKTYPLKMSFIGEGFHMNFVLAPRMDND